MIRRGRVTVDGEPATIGQKVDPAAVRVFVDGVPLPVQGALVHYLLYKPVGTISTASDPAGRQTVVDLVPDDVRVYPVGRLDADSEGLLILTNDGDLANRITHPRYEVPKRYAVLVDGRPPKGALRSLTQGVELEDGPARAAGVRTLAESAETTLIEVTMTEGRNREVRRMFSAVGHPVQRLVRTAIGPVRDAELGHGKWRMLAIEEVRALYAAGSGAWEHATGAVEDHEGEQ